MPLNNPYDDVRTGGRWYKGSLHAHSETEEMYPGSGDNDEDKPRPAGAVLTDYATLGYEFVVLSEQNNYTTQQELQNQGLDQYGLTVIPGAELDGRLVTTAQHLGHLNPSAGSEVTTPTALAAIVSNAGTQNNDSLITQLHPQFPREPDGREMNILGSRGVNALEVVNSWWMQRPHAFEDSGGKYSPFAFHLWDRLLKPIEGVTGERVWGVAGCCSVAQRDVGLSWIKVWLDQDQGNQPRVDSLMSAISDGKFYLSSVSTPRDPSRPAGPDNPPNVLPPKATGVTIEDVKVNAQNGTVTIETDAERVYAIVDGSPRLTVNTTQGLTQNLNPGTPETFETFTFPDPQRFPNAEYIRFECVGDDDTWDQSYDWDNTQKLNRSWTQPIWVN